MSPCHSTLPQSLALGHSATLRTQPLALSLSLASLCHAYHSVTGALLPAATLTGTLAGCHSEGATLRTRVPLLSELDHVWHYHCHYYRHCKKHGKGPVASLLLSLPPRLSLGGLADTLTIRSMAEGPGAVSLTHSLTHSLPASHLAAWRSPSSLGARPLGGRP